MSFKKRPERKTLQKQRSYRQPLFSLLFLLSGIYGICLLLLSVPGLRWNRGEVFLLAGLPGILLWYLDGRKRRLFLCLGLLAVPGGLAAALYHSPGLLRETASAALRLAGFTGAGEGDVTEGLLCLLWLLSYLFFLLEFLFHTHWLLYLLMSALLLAAPFFGISPNGWSVLLILVFQITFWSMHGLLKKGRKNRRSRRENLLPVLRISALVMTGTAVLFAAAFFVVEQSPEWFYGTAYQAERFVQRTAKQMSSWTNQPEDGSINRGNLYPADVEQLEILVSEMPTETLYLKGFCGGEYAEGEWLPQTDEELFARMIEKTPYWRYWEESIPGMFSNLYYEMNKNTEHETTLPDRVLVIRNLESIEEQPLEYAPYYSSQSRWGRNGYIFRYYEREEMQIDWEEVSPDMEEDAAWYQNIQEAYQEEAQTAYTAVSAEDVPRLAALCAANPQEDLEHITAFILRTLHQIASYSTTPGVIPLHEDPVEYFLFESGEGYCQHFASAAVLMYRLYGIPARYVTGYAVKPSDFEMRMGDYGHRAVITDASAHAWPEIFIEDLGWTPVEVTPSGEDYEAYDSGLDMERLQNIWEEEQQQMEEVLPSTAPQVTETQPEKTDTETSSVPPLSSREDPPVVSVILFLLFLLVILYICREMRRADERQMDVRQAFGRLLLMLHRAGYLREYDGSEEDFGARLAELFPEEDPAELARFVRLAEKRAFGQRAAEDKSRLEEDAFARTLWFRMNSSLLNRQAGWRKLWFLIRKHCF